MMLFTYSSTKLERDLFMNTSLAALPAQSASLFASREEFLTFQQAWKQATNDPVLRKQLRAEHYLLRALLFGRDPAIAFTPVTNPRKLIGGRWPGDTLCKTRDLLFGVAWEFEHAAQRGDPALLDIAQQRLTRFAGPLAGALTRDLILRAGAAAGREDAK
jgi:hypothetical protein